LSFTNFIPNHLIVEVWIFEVSIYQVFPEFVGNS
jgi:hypothetical protein